MLDLLSMREMFDALPSPIFAKDKDHRYIYGNRAFGKMLEDPDFLGKTDSDYFPDSQAAIFYREDARVLNGQVSVSQEEIGENILALTSKHPVHFSNGEAGLIGVVMQLDSPESRQSHSDGRDSASFGPASVEKLKSLQALLIQTMNEKREAINQTLTDPATGLRNRKGFEEDFAYTLKTAKEHNHQFVLMFADLDHFKKINDRLGHHVGDEILKKLAERYKAVSRFQSVSRLGEDEFAVLMVLDKDEQPTYTKAGQDIYDALYAPIQVGNKTIAISASLGIVAYPDFGQTVEELRQNADAALWQAKATGRGKMVIFDKQLQKAFERRRLLEDSLPDAIKNGKITPYFQPVVSSETRQTVSAEVLSRWIHPELGFVPPDEFIALASDCGQLTELDSVIFDEACRLAAPLLRSGKLQQLSINASPDDISASNFAERITRRIETHGLRPDHICIEIVETAAIHDMDTVRENLNQLHEAGVCIALDDFGTGYSNLRLLLDLPLDRVKIDRSLIQDMETNTAVFDLFLTIVNLAGILNVAMVAEGLETDFSALMVTSAGVSHLQGYYFAKPMPFAEFDSFLSQEKQSETAA